MSSLALQTRLALGLGLAGFLAIFFGLQIETSPLADVTNDVGDVIATCRAGRLYSWPGQGFGIGPPPGPPVANLVPTPCPYGKLHSRAQIGVNNDLTVRGGVAATALSVLWQILLVRDPAPTSPPVQDVSPIDSVDRRDDDGIST